MSQLKKVRVRFPPSPTGELHLGSARTALYNFLFARHHGGQMIFRIEDTDQARYVPGAMDRFFEDLKWLGITWDEGPDVGGPHGPYIQSERTELYRQAADQLVSQGKAYRCWCTPDRLEQMRNKQIMAKERPHYDRHCLNLSQTEQDTNKEKSSVIRLLVPEGTTTFTDLIRGTVRFDNDQIDDQILVKSDGFPTYHLANVVDDHAMDVSHVIRGEEWLPSTPKHLLLYHAFGWTPPLFSHLPLILNEQRQKLSKRRDGQAVWVSTYRKQGFLPEALINYLALLGWNPGDALPAGQAGREVFSLDDLVKEFSLERVHKAGAIFDEEKLKFLNAHYLRQRTDEELLKILKKGDYFSHQFSQLPAGEQKKWLTISRDRIKTLTDFSALIDPLLEPPPLSKERLIFKKSDVERTNSGLEAAIAALEDATTDKWQSVESLHQLLEAVVVETGLNNGDVFWPVRVALSSAESSPPPAELLWVLGKKEAFKRLRAAQTLLSV